jgi:hypothetical protein
MSEPEVELIGYETDTATLPPNGRVRPLADLNWRRFAPRSHNRRVGPLGGHSLRRTMSHLFVCWQRGISGDNDRRGRPAASSSGGI